MKGEIVEPEWGKSAKRERERESTEAFAHPRTRKELLGALSWVGTFGTAPNNVTWVTKRQQRATAGRESTLQQAAKKKFFSGDPRTVFRAPSRRSEQSPDSIQSLQSTAQAFK